MAEPSHARVLVYLGVHSTTYAPASPQAPARSFSPYAGRDVHASAACIETHGRAGISGMDVDMWVGVVQLSADASTVVLTS